ncbi:MAG: DNA primase [Streptococcaceae bacterium]|jgi:DNA primase|nr:DNA primase [Streptococcaceae bacterium]
MARIGGMMALLDKEKIAEIKSNVDIVDVISQHVHLSKSGTNYLGLCPFHGEKTPSFNVNAQKQFYHCFGCGKSGDVYKFIEDYKQVPFLEAVAEVAEVAGVALNLGEKSTRVDPNQSLYELHTQAARIYHTVLTSTEEGAKARAYLLDRGISDEIIDTFNIGLSLSDNDFLYQSVKQKFEESVLMQSGLITFSEQRIFDSFRGRIMFPLNNEKGQVIAFSGRTWLPDDVANKQLAKYKNSTTTPIFNKSEALYNIDRAKASIKKTHEVYLMEGFMDVIAAYQNGVNNVVASMGTALTAGHIRKLRPLAKQFVLVYDGDKAGQNAIYKALDLLEAKEVAVVRMPDGLDPDDYHKSYPGALANLMHNSRMAPVAFLMDYLRPANLSNLQGQLDFIDLMAPKIAQVDSLTAQDAYIKRLVEILPDFEYNQVETAVNKRREQAVSSQESPEAFLGYDESLMPPPPEDNGYFYEPTPIIQSVSPVVPIKLSPIEQSEMQLLHRMIYHPSVLARILSEHGFQFVHQRYQALFDLMKDLETVDEASLMVQVTGEAAETFYEVLSLVHVPEEVSDLEVDDLLKNFVKASKASQLQTLQEQLEQAKQTGNSALELQLTLQIIAQKQQDGV